MTRNAASTCNPPVFHVDCNISQCPGSQSHRSAAHCLQYGNETRSAIIHSPDNDCSNICQTNNPLSRTDRLEDQCSGQSENNCLLAPQTTRSNNLFPLSLCPCSSSTTGLREFDPPSPLITDESDGCCCHSFCYPSKTTRFSCERARPLVNCLSTIMGCFLLPISWNRRRLQIPNENLLVLSIIQLLCGFASVILSSVALTKAVFLYQMATGMWAGFLMLITGTQGLITARRPIMCTLVGLLVLCAVTTTSACLLIGVSVAGTIEDGFLHRLGSKPKSSSYQVIKFTYAFQNQHPFKNLLPDHLGLFRGPLNLSTSGPLRFKTIDNDFTPISDSHLRTCQVIIHVLLLLVGILESSVGLSTCVICCRYVCSRYGRSRVNQNPYNARTNIVSFDARTASQAATVLESGTVSRYLGTGNVLLAVASDSLAGNEPHSPTNTGDASTPPKPCVHHTVAPFIPESNRSALILTQAGAGSMAWTAARAAAALVDQNRCSTSTPGTARPKTLSVFHRVARMKSRCERLHLSRRSHRPRLMFTSLYTPRTCSGELRQPPSIEVNDTGVPSYPPGSTLLYVMPSPSRDEPPMIFPPFPPTYSSLQQRPSLIPGPRITQRPVSSTQGTVTTNRSNSRTDSTNRFSFPRCSFFTRTRVQRPRTTSHHRTGRTSSRLPNARGSAPIPICAVDRLLQPVLIVGDPRTCISSSPPPADPPKYSSVDPNPLLDPG